jgi:hypothetical protein
MPAFTHPISLGGIGYAVGANGNATSQTSLAADGRGSAILTSMTSFYYDMDGVYLTPEPYDTSGDGDGTIVTETANFLVQGSLAATRILNRDENTTITYGCTFVSTYYHKNSTTFKWIYDE